MGRTRNPDYFKVGGGTAGSGSSASGRFEKDKSRLAGQRSRLSREAPAKAKAPKPRAEGPVARVSERTPEKPRRGKKRRAAARRHDAGVERGLDEQRRTRVALARRPPSITELLGAGRPAGSGAPSGGTAKPGMATRLWHLGREAVLLAVELATVPFALVRLAARRPA